MLLLSVVPFPHRNAFVSVQAARIMLFFFGKWKDLNASEYPCVMCCVVLQVAEKKDSDFAVQMIGEAWATLLSIPGG